MKGEGLQLTPTHQLGAGTETASPRECLGRLDPDPEARLGGAWDHSWEHWLNNAFWKDIVRRLCPETSVLILQERRLQEKERTALFLGLLLKSFGISKKRAVPPSALPGHLPWREEVASTSRRASTNGCETGWPRRGAFGISV